MIHFNVPSRRQALNLFRAAGAGLIACSAYMGKIKALAPTLPALGIVTPFPKILKEAKRVTNESDMTKRLNASMKMTAAFGNAVLYSAYTLIALETVPLETKLRSMGAASAASLYTSLEGWASGICTTGLILSAAQSAVNLRSWGKTNHYLHHFQMQEWFRDDESYTDKDFEHAKAYLEKFGPKEIKNLGKRLQVDGEALKNLLLKKMENATSSEQKSEEMKKYVQLMLDKLQTSKRFHRDSAFVGLLSTAGLLASVLQQGAPQSSQVIKIATLANWLFCSIARYRFENAAGMIERKDEKPQLWKDYAIDYSKWQVGWHDDKSLFNRMLNTGKTVLAQAKEIGSKLNETVVAIVTPDYDFILEA